MKLHVANFILIKKKIKIIPVAKMVWLRPHAIETTFSCFMAKKSKIKHRADTIKRSKVNTFDAAWFVDVVLVSEAELAPIVRAEHEHSAFFGNDSSMLVAA